MNQLADMNWNRSSFCAGGDCIEVGWVKSSFSSETANCVEVKRNEAQVLVRDSKLGDESEVLRFAVASWWVLLDAIVIAKDPTQVHHRCVRYEPDGSVVLSTSVASPRLRFTPAEWEAFVFGVQVKEFDPDVLEKLSSPAVDSRGGEPSAGREVEPFRRGFDQVATGAVGGAARHAPGRAAPVAAESLDAAGTGTSPVPVPAAHHACECRGCCNCQQSGVWLLDGVL